MLIYGCKYKIILNIEIKISIILFIDMIKTWQNYHLNQMLFLLSYIYETKSLQMYRKCKKRAYIKCYKYDTSRYMC